MQPHACRTSSTAPHESMTACVLGLAAVAAGHRRPCHSLCGCCARHGTWATHCHPLLSSCRGCSRAQQSERGVVRHLACCLHGTSYHSIAAGLLHSNILLVINLQTRQKGSA